MPLPDRGALTEGAAALGVALSETQATLLFDYLALVSKWNRVYNLTAVRKPEDMLVQHLLDSLGVVAPLRRWAGGKAKRLLDAGSGAGLPGVVVAVLLPGFEVTCVDAVGKKAAFVRQVAAELGLKNLASVQARVEAMQGVAADAITSRAFASLRDFTALTRRHLGEGAVWVAMKAAVPAGELAALPPDVEVFHVEQLIVPGLHADRCLVWMRLRA